MATYGSLIPAIIPVKRRSMKLGKGPGKAI